MKTRTLFLAATATMLSLASCNKNDDKMEEAETQMFTLTIENIQTPYAYQSTGVFNTPAGATEPGGAGPGNAYEFTVHAGMNSKLSFATMFVGSNDLFFGTESEGMNLYENGVLMVGDVTSKIKLWDAGTEVNEEPGNGPNQPMNQSGPNTGMDENGMVKDINNVSDGFTYPSVANTIKVMISEGSMPNEVIVKIENLAGSTTPIAPGVWFIHNSGNPIFMENTADKGNGLEALAEDGNPSGLYDYSMPMAGINTPFAPGAWAVHNSGNNPIFMMGEMASSGLETLAEDGNPANLSTAIASATGVSSSGVFNTPMGKSDPAALFPGEKYEFDFSAKEGELISLATMYVQSNDLFYGFGKSGLELWNGSTPKSGDLNSDIKLWDAGTEVNELPGYGMNQPVRQSGPNTGSNEDENVMEVNDGFVYLMNDKSIKVTLSLK